MRVFVKHDFKGDEFTVNYGYEYWQALFIPHGTREMVDAFLIPGSERSPALQEIFLQHREQWDAIEKHRRKYIAQRKENAEVLQRIDFNTPVCSLFMMCVLFVVENKTSV